MFSSSSSDSVLVHARCWFVQQDQRGAAHHGPGDLQPALHPVREVDGLLALHPGEAEPREHLVDRALGRPGRGGGLDVLPDGELGEQADVLERARESQRGDLVRLAPADLLPVEDHVAFGGDVDARDHVEQRGLARPVGSDQPEDLAGSHLDVDAGERHHPFEMLRDLLTVEHRRRRGIDGLDHRAGILLRHRHVRSPRLGARVWPTGGTGAPGRRSPSDRRCPRVAGSA